MPYRCPGCQQQPGRSLRVSVATAVVVLIVLAVLACVVPSVVVRSIGYQNHVRQLHLAPGGTSVIDYSAILCSKLTLAGENLPRTAGLYLLKDPQPVHNSILNVTQTRLYIDRGQYKYWHFSLLPGSTIRLSLCAVFPWCRRRRAAQLQAGFKAYVELYLLTGRESFQEFLKKKTPKVNKTVLVSQSSVCNPTEPFQKNITEANIYYVVFKYVTHGVTNNSHTHDVSVHINMTIDQTEYDTSALSCNTNSGSVHDERCCELSDNIDSCAVAIADIRQKYTAAVNIDAGESEFKWNLDNYLYVTVSCDPRWWFYIIVAVSGLLLLLTPAAIVAASYCWYTRRPNNGNRFQPIEETPPVQTVRGGLAPQPTINPASSSSASPYSQHSSPQEPLWQHRPHSARNTGSGTPLSPSTHLLQHHVHASPWPVHSGQSVVARGGHCGSTGKSLQSLAAFSSQQQFVDDEEAALLEEEVEEEEEEEEEDSLN